jgi:hypothetical protein
MQQQRQPLMWMTQKFQPASDQGPTDSPGDKSNQKALTDIGWGASCPRSQDNAGMDKPFGL